MADQRLHGRINIAKSAELPKPNGTKVQKQSTEYFVGKAAGNQMNALKIE